MTVDLSKVKKNAKNVLLQLNKINNVFETVVF